MIVEVIPATRTNIDLEVFSYSIPKELEDDIKVGSIVTVPFGKKKLRGVVKKIKNDTKCHPELQREALGSSKVFRGSTEVTLRRSRGFKIKDIISVNPNFLISKAYLLIIDWISKYYFCTLGEALSLFLPPEMKNPRKQEVWSKKSKKSKKNFKKLNTEQKKIFTKLKSKLVANDKKPALIHGVTGSGKTEVYIHLAHEILKVGKQVIVLVPEIILTPQTVERFREAFGDEIALIHSKISKSEKYHCYHDFYNGNKKIIVGPRSALLLPSNNIGLIIVDEEQEDAYKQDKNPRYNAIDLAEQIAKRNDALLVLGTATPRVETYHKSKVGIYDLFELKNRHNQLLLPPAEIVDLREEIKKKNYSPLSETMIENIENTIKKKKQVLLFINRRGTSTFVSCRECGYVENCPNCEIPLIHHINNHQSSLRCHHCDFKKAVPTSCPECKSVKIKFFGSGIEKVEYEIVKLFPKAKIKRVDSETIKSSTDHKKFYDDFKNHKINIAIGTQMLAKGFDIPGVDLVGIVSADVGLHMPHFRASEKTFRILTQVSGRSGRSHNVGKTVIQSYWPKSGAIEAASKHDYQLFYEEEIKHRKELGYPPFSQIIRVISENRSNDKAKKEIQQIVSDLEKENIEFIGPSLCFFQRLRGKWRYHIIIKLKNQKSKIKIMETFKKHQYLTWDVDPYDLV